MKNHTKRFYSQNGEDCILDELFKDQRTGFFVEIGCIDGKRFSNTLTFEERGWKGLCVEAHTGYIELLEQNRPNSIICHCAASFSDEENVPFYANNRGSLSTLDPTKEDEFKQRFGKFFAGFELQHVPKRKLDTIFEQYNINHIDILSIDVEGNEEDVLKGLNLEKYRPRVMVIEADTPTDEEKLDRILLNAGYSKSIKIVNNVFYLLDKQKEEVLKNRKLEATLIHTQHPLDSDGDMMMSFSFQYPGPAITQRKSI